MSAAWLARALAASALVVLAGWCVDELLRLSGRQRRWAWLVALVAATALPWAARWLPAGPLGAWLGAWLGRSAATAPPAWLLAAGSVASAGPSAGAPARDRVAVALVAWAAASVALLALFVASAITVRRRTARWRRERVDGLEVRVSPAAGPMVVGWLRPVVVLPEWAVAASPAERSLMLAHELEHVERRDPLLLALGALLVVLTPWNPLVWLQRRMLRARVETDCDARVLARGVDRRSYGELLLRTAAAPRLGPAFGLSLVTSTTLLERRIRTMTEDRAKLRWLKATTAAFVGGVAVVAACGVAGEPTSPTEVAPQRVEVAKVPTGEKAPVMVLDGRVASDAEVKALAPDQVARVNVYKGPGSYALGALDGVAAGWLAQRADAERAEVRLRAEAYGVVDIRTRGAKSVTVPDAQASAQKRRMELETVHRRARESDAAGREHTVTAKTPTGVRSRLPKSWYVTAQDIAAPLYVVDGHALRSDEALSVDRNDVASIEVLKGAAAERAYGTRGANGVILITTKK